MNEKTFYGKIVADGNSKAVRLPRNVVDGLNLNVGNDVQIRIKRFVKAEFLDYLFVLIDHLLSFDVNKYTGKSRDDLAEYFYEEGVKKAIGKTLTLQEVTNLSSKEMKKIGKITLSLVQDEISKEWKKINDKFKV